MNRILFLLCCCLFLSGCSQLGFLRTDTLPPPTSNGELDDEYYQRLVSYNIYVDAQLAYVESSLKKKPREQDPEPTPSGKTESNGCNEIFELPLQTPPPSIPVVDSDDPDAVANAMIIYVTKLRAHRKEYQIRLEDEYEQYRKRCMSKKT